MRIIVTGGRTYADPVAVASALQAVWNPITHSTPQPTLVHGDASGADRLAARFAEQLGWSVEAHPADWSTHGRAAGPIRNQEMADLGGDLLLAFPGGRGTADMVRRARAAGIPVHEPG